MKDKYIEYFKKTNEISLPEFQSVFNLSYLRASKLIEEYEERGVLEHADDFAYKYLGEPRKAQDESQAKRPPSGGKIAVKKMTINEELKRQRQARYEKAKRIILDYIKDQPCYLEKEKTFETVLQIYYPDESKYTLKFVEDGGLYLTDNGGFLRCIKKMLENQTGKINTGYIIMELSEIGRVEFKDDEVYLDVSRTDSFEDLDEDVLFFISIFENIFKRIEKQRKENTRSLLDIMEDAREEIFELLSRKSIKNEAEHEGAAMDVIEIVSSIHKEMTRLMAAEYSDKILEIAKSQHRPLHELQVLERVKNEFLIASDAEYDLLKKQIFGE